MENKMKRTLLVLSILVLAASAFAWTITGTFNADAGFDFVGRITIDVVNTSTGDPAGTPVINADGTYSIYIPNEWTGNVTPIIAQVTGYTCTVSPNTVSYTIPVIRQPVAQNWTITCTQDFLYTLNVISVPSFMSVFKNAVDTTEDTDYTFTDADVANVIGTYTLETPPFGSHWEPAFYEVVATDFNEGNNWTRTIIFELVDDTLPVELSSFTAVLTSDMYVKIAWISESETNHAGYNILRSEVRELSSATLINNGMINQGTANGSQMNYLYTDTEVATQGTYYYWLESVSLNGACEYFGPLNVTISTGGDQPGIPNIPVETTLLTAFPNPFNPSTNLRYSMKEAGDARIDIYNSKGQLMKTYSASHNQAGYYQIYWDGHDLNGQLASTGVYFYRMTSGNYASTKKMVLTK